MVMYLVVEIVLVQSRRAFVIFARMCCCRMYRTVVHILTFAFFVVFDWVGFWSGDVQRGRWQSCRVCVPFCWAGLPVLYGYAVCFTVLRCCGSLLHIGLCDRYTLAHSKQNSGCRVSKVSHLWLRREGQREIAHVHRAGGFLTYRYRRYT